MKIIFNPIVKNNQTYFKPQKTNALQQQNQPKTSSLNCLANYNLSFAKRAVYAINYDGSYEKFDTIKESAKGKSLTGIMYVLAGRMNCAEGKVYAYADEMEFANGEIDPKAINKAILNFKDADNQPIYSIDFYGNMQRFDSVPSASKILGINTSNIVGVLLDYQKATFDYTFIKAFDVELRDKSGKILKGENNNPILDIELINKKRAKFLDKGKGYPVVSIDKEGNVKQYGNTDAAMLDLNCARKNISQSIANLAITQKQYVFTRLSDVVQVDEFGDVVFDCDNNFVIDCEKIEEIRKLVFERK